MWKRGRAARWFDSPTGSALRRKKAGWITTITVSHTDFFVFFFFLSTPLLFVSDEGKAKVSIFLSLFLPSCRRLAGCSYRLSFSNSSQFLALWRPNSRVQDLNQISPDSGLSLSDLWNSFPILQYVLFCLCRPRDELLLLNSIDAELVSSHSCTFP